MSIEKELEKLKSNGEAPEWLTPEGFSTISGGYLLKGETPKDMWMRCANASAARLNNPALAKKFFEAMWKNWLCLASPVASNMGTERGLPISCYGAYVEDSIVGIMNTLKEIAILSKHGGGIGTFWGDVRPRGATIKDNGHSD